jgi:hypothetical protein
MPDAIAITFDFKNPIPVEEFGEVFTALARDYREISRGRSLVIASIENGSIIASLTDATLVAAPYVGGGLAAIAAVNSLATFAGHLEKWFGKAKSDSGAKLLFQKRRKSVGQRSVEAMIKAAANTSSHIRVRHATENGEILEVEVSPTEARKIRDVAASNETRAVQINEGLVRVAHPEIARAVASLHQVSGGNLSSTQMQTFVDVIVATLRSLGASHALSELASNLELHGMSDVAFAVRQHIKKSGGTNEPPLTTT